MTMKIFLYIMAALCGYAVAGMNPAIAISKAVYHKDIRECGSGNPGFTNFRRVFGNKWAFAVLILDLLKAAAVTVLFGWLLSKKGVDFQFAAAYTGIFCLLGHVFPFQYKFKGGKGFLVCLSIVFVVDFRVGLIAAVLLHLLLLVTKYMSLSTVITLLASSVLIYLFGASLPVTLMMLGCALLVALRHKENFIRLRNGTESKFSFKSNK